MAAQATIAAIIKRAREASIKVLFYFKGHRCTMVIDHLIRAEEKDTSKAIEWSRAFGSLTPGELFSSVPIEKIEVHLLERTLTFNNLKEFLKYLLA